MANRSRLQYPFQFPIDHISFKNFDYIRIIILIYTSNFEVENLHWYFRNFEGRIRPGSAGTCILRGPMFSDSRSVRLFRLSSRDRRSLSVEFGVPNLPAIFFLNV